MRRYLLKRARPIPPNIILGILFVMLAGVAGWFAHRHFYRQPVVTDFKSCVAAGQPVLLSHPVQCTYNGQSYIDPGENIPPAY